MAFDKEAPAALVTGGSRGIGAAIARQLALDGFQIILTYVSRAEEALAVVEEIKKIGQNAAAFALNVGDSVAIENFFAAEIRDRINLYAMINNAGLTRDGLLLRMKNENFDRVIDVDLRGPFICAREAAKIMTRKRAGRIVNVSSVVGQSGNAGQVNYSAAKAGLIGLTKSCAKELASRSITVNAVAPGFIETDMTRGLDEKTRDTYKAAIPLGRLGSPEDVAGAVSFLVSEKAAYVTGQVIAVNGGLYC